jgi:oxygen-independent coproporphyrinogen-3 oxidase
VHIPYCLAKCPYCDFNSFAATQWPEERYTEALRAEMKSYAAAPDWAGRHVQTIFFGGGTPSLFGAASIRDILKTAAELWPSDSPEMTEAGDKTPAAPEITLEANPGSIGPETLPPLLEAGINRLSLGVQSFLSAHLHTLGRIHSPQDAIDGVRMARTAGFGNISVDLMFALPEQTLEQWRSDLEQAISLEPEHISAYNLTYEESTAFHQWRAQGLLRQLPEEAELGMFGMAQKLLQAAGYEHYEISNYARPGYRCAHNLNYWRHGEYLGLGAGAHSFVVGEWNEDSQGRRWSNLRSPAAYMQAIETKRQARETVEDVDERQASGEFVFLALRCREGFAESRFRKRFGSAFADVFPHADELRRQGLLQNDHGRWFLSPRGLRLADSVFATFL